MNSPILSQGEIDALLQNNISQTPSEELLSLLSTASHAASDWIIGASSQPIELQGTYVELLSKSWKQTAQNAFAVAADLDDLELLVLINQEDGEKLAQSIPSATPQLIVQRIAQTWVSELANLVGLSYVVYQAQNVNLSALEISDGEAPTYLVRNLLKRSKQRAEFSVIISGLEKLESLAKQPPQGIKFSNRGRATMTTSKLLKGTKSPVTEAVFTPIHELPQVAEQQEINLLEDIDLLVTVELGKTTLTLNEILELKKQSVIRLERLAGEPVDVYINNNRAAKGEVVVLEENFGVRILEIVPQSQRGGE